MEMDEALSVITELHSGPRAKLPSVHAMQQFLVRGSGRCLAASCCCAAAPYCVRKQSHLQDETQLTEAQKCELLVERQRRLRKHEEAQKGCAGILERFQVQLALQHTNRALQGRT